MSSTLSSIERQGLRNLTAKIEPYAGKQRCFVRVVYETMGGELCAVQAGPMSQRAAEGMAGHYRIVVFKIVREATTRARALWDHVPTGRAGAAGAFACTELGHPVSTGVPKEWRDARLVVFPSQEPNPIRQYTVEATTILGEAA